MKTILALVLVTFLGHFVRAADTARLNEPAPPLDLEELLQAPEGAVASWEAFKGKAVILEFWATWCGPCIEAVPHLNQLADEFKGQPVQFIAITDEKEELIKTFLKRKAMRAWIGLDTDRSVFKSFGVGGIPHTVLITSNGIVARVTHPAGLTSEHIQDLLAGKISPSSAPPADGERVAAQSSEERAKPIYEVSIRPNSGTESRSSSGPSGRNQYGRTWAWNASGTTVHTMLTSAYQVSKARLVVKSKLPEDLFDAVMTLPLSAADRYQALLQDVLETTFGLVHTKEQRDLDAYVLTADQPKLDETVSTGGSSASSGPGRISAVNSGVQHLARSLEELLDTPVFDETGLTGRYDFQLRWEQADKNDASYETIQAALREQLGLALKPVKRTIEVVVVEKAPSEEKE